MCETQCGWSTLPANTRCWPNAGPLSARLPSIKPALFRVWWAARAAGLAVHDAVCGEYKPTPTQCLLNVGSALPMLASIHSLLVSTSCWRDCVHIACTAPMPFKHSKHPKFVTNFTTQPIIISFAEILLIFVHFVAYKNIHMIGPKISC